MPLEIKYVGYGLMIVLLMIVAIQNIGTNASATFDEVARELEAEPLPPEPNPDPSAEVRAALDRLATSIAPVAIQASLIPRNLLDRERMQHQIQGLLKNQVGDDWTVEVTCYAGWCNIKIKYATAEIVIDANNGSATKSVYLN